jgi:hypothetical protein
LRKKLRSEKADMPGGPVLLSIKEYSDVCVFTIGPAHTGGTSHFRVIDIS